MARAVAPADAVPAPSDVEGPPPPAAPLAPWLRINSGGGKANKKGKHDSFDGPVRKASMTEDKLKICGAWNSARGCADREHLCPQRGKHLCSVILSSGIVCKSRDHIAQTHFSR